MAGQNYFDQFDEGGGPTVTPLPESPGKKADRERDDANANRDNIRTGIAVRGETRDIGYHKFDQTDKVAKDYNGEPAVKSYRVAVGQLAQALGTADGPQGDLALTYAFAKGMDPDSVVRDAEQTMQTQSQPWFQAKVEAVKKQFGMDGAGAFTPQARAALRQELWNATEKRSRVYNARRQHYAERAQRAGLDPEDVVGPHDGAPFHQDFRDFAGKPRDPLGDFGGNVEMGAAKGGNYSTPDDMAIAKAVEGAYRRKGSQPQDLFDAARSAGYEPTINDVRQWRAAVDYRNQTGKFTQVIPRESGQRSSIGQAFGDLAASPTGTFAINAADQWAGGGGLDEIAGVVNGTFGPRSIGDEIAWADMGKQAGREANPNAALAGQFVGGLSQGYGAAKAFPNALGAINTLPRILAAGGAYGGLEGALESNGDRLTGGAIGTGVGAAGGLVGAKVVAPALDALMRSKGGQAVSSAFREGTQSLPPRFRLGQQPAVPTFAPGETQLPSLANPAGQRAVQNIRDAADMSLPYALADADPRLRMLAGSVARKSPDARMMAEDAFNPRAEDQAERAMQGVSEYLAPPVDIAARQADWRTTANQRAHPLYEEAYQGGSTAPLENQLQDAFNTSSKAVADARAALAQAQRGATVSSAQVNRAGNNVYGNAQALPADRAANAAIAGAEQRLAQAEAQHAQVLEQLRRSQGDAASNAPGAVWNPRLQQFIDDPLSKGGMARGLEIQRLEALAEGRPFNPTEYAVTGTDEAGNPIIGNVPNLRTLDALKKGYDSILDEYPRDMKGNQIFDQRGRAITMAKQSLVGELDNVTGGELGPYASARNTYGTFAQLGNTLDEGYRAVPRGTYARDIRSRIGGMDQANLGEYQLGYATRLRDQIADAGDTSDPYRQIYGGSERRAKMATVFPEGAPKFDRLYQLEQDMAKTRTETLGGSPTAARSAADQIFDSPAAGAADMAFQVGTGGGVSPLALAKIAGPKLADHWRVGMGSKKADALAPILFNANPRAVLDYIDSLAQRQIEDGIRKTAFQRRGGLFGAVVAPALTGPLGQ